jgi:hypothetical protein
VEWDWTPSVAADAYTSILVVVDSPSDPIPSSAKIFDIAQLVTNEKRIGLASLHIVDLLPTAFIAIRLRLFTSAGAEAKYVLRLPSFDNSDVRLSMLLPKALSKRAQDGSKTRGLTSSVFSDRDSERLKTRLIAGEMRTDESWQELVKTYDMSRQYRVSRRTAEVELPLHYQAGGLDEIMLLARGVTTPQSDEPWRFTVQQMTTTGDIVGGSTFVFKQTKTAVG